jgi:hypothetical protein
MTFTSTVFKDSIAYDGGAIYLFNTASVSFSLITMTQGKARRYGGGIYAGGTGAASISYSNCATAVSYF